MSSIAVAKLGMGYQTASQRPGCAGCKHVSEHLDEHKHYPYDKPIYRCKKGGFNTSAMAICREHEPKRTQIPP